MGHTALFYFASTQALTKAQGVLKASETSSRRSHLQEADDPRGGEITQEYVDSGEHALKTKDLASQYAVSPGGACVCLCMPVGVRSVHAFSNPVSAHRVSKSHMGRASVHVYVGTCVCMCTRGICVCTKYSLRPVQTQTDLGALEYVLMRACVRAVCGGGEMCVDSVGE